MVREPPPNFAEAGAARLRPGSRVAYVIASLMVDFLIASVSP